jgi:hypothetical protein
MATITVTLTDEEPCEVRRLRLYELDSVARDLADPGPFTYEVPLSRGNSITDVYIMPDEPPKKPSTPFEECKAGDIEAMQWDEYKIYWAAVNHQVKRIQMRKARDLARAEYIFTTCLSGQDQQRILSTEDWDIVHTAAQCPEVTIEELNAVLGTTFEATYDGLPILEALGHAPGSNTSYLARS